MTSLDTLSKNISSLAAALNSTNKARSPVEQEEELAKALKASKDVNWDLLVPAIEEALSAAKSEVERLLSERRQKMLEMIKSKDIYFRTDSEEDTVDVFKVKYRKTQAVVEFAGVEVQSFDELDGAKLADAILAIRPRLERASLDRSRLFSLVSVAISHANGKNPSRDGYVDLGTIYREVVFEQAWQKTSFAKSASAKHFPEYPFHQFLWDLAAFFAAGNSEGRSRLAGRTPSMSERANSYRLPNLRQPHSPGEVIHMLRVEKTQD